MAHDKSPTGREGPSSSQHRLIPDRWRGADSPIGRHITTLTRQCLDAYRANPRLVPEHANIERAAAQGGYGRRQIYELVQNGADAMLDSPGGLIHVVLTPSALYCANDGEPITQEGAENILASHMSQKRGAEIGRFGLGFKSVLGVTDRPEFYSLTGSFKFNAADAEAQIRDVVPNAERYPVLRVAQPLDPHSAAADDSILASLMQWAATVVRLPRGPVRSVWLPEDVARFPAKFLLFSPHVGKLILEDRSQNRLREIRLRTEGDWIHLEEDGSPSSWRVFRTDYVPTQAARKDAGALADRATLPIMWAVALEGKESTARGQFWAFFPTEYVTTLSGIVNAPWKTNEDRQNLLTGLFNEELIDAAAKLIASSLTSLQPDNDPGRFLDLMPARGREAPNWADARLTDQVYARAAELAVVPDQNRKPRHATQLHLHPPGLPREALESWAAYPERPRDWCHVSVDTRERRSRVERLFSASGQEAESIATWLQALADDRSPEASVAALRTAAAILQAPTTTASQRSQIEGCRILLTRKGVLVQARAGAAFITLEPPPGQSEIPLVHPSVIESEEGRAALAVLGIGELDPSSELQALLSGGPLLNMTASRWQGFWQVVGRVPFAKALELLKAYEKRNGSLLLSVRTLSGKFRPLGETLLPGAIVPADGSRDADVAVDTQYHKAVLPLLGELGAVELPRQGSLHRTEQCYHEYRREAAAEFYGLIPRGTSRPLEQLLVFDQSSTAGPLDPMLGLSDEGKSRFTERLLLTAADEPMWTLHHGTRTEYYPKLTLPPPSLWIVRRHGRLRTSLGIRSVHESVAPSLRRLSRFLPVADVTEKVGELLELPTSESQFSPTVWRSALEHAEAVDDDSLLGSFYAWAAPWIDPPERIRCRTGSGPLLQSPMSVAVAYDSDELRALARSKLPFLRVADAEEAKALAQHWHLRPAREVVKFSVYSAPTGPEMPLLDRFPGLATHLHEERESYVVVPCSSVRMDTITRSGKAGEERRAACSGNILYYLDRLTNAELLDEICESLNIRLPRDERADILEQRELNERRQRVLEIRQKETYAEKLVAAVGADAIHRHLPAALVSAAKEQYGGLSDRQAAQLAIACYGVGTLQEFKDDLLHAGLEPPLQWAGSHKARQFVRELGFPKEYAGFREARRDAVLEVDGPPQLPLLHAFQERIVAHVREVLEGRADTKRALLSLPTGAGKTRVMVESLIRAVADDGLSGPILWIAQTDELCEQAVQTWSEVWRGVGPRGRLHINRLWASNEADPYEDAAQVVIATDAKLGAACIENPSYDWLTQAACVVIDEAHIATQPSYTRILEWAGLKRGSDRCPLFGLTATPFRGGVDQTKFLVGRFGRLRLDEGALGEDPYTELQKMGVLAWVDHELLDGVKLELTHKELEELRALRSLPASAADRIGADTSRNRVLLESIKNMPQDWPVLLFAASVDHAHAMAALLTAEGIPSAAISSGTEPGARRHYVEQFRSGTLRVLTNYAVLTAGFDAPSVRALYVARPTYSPGLYQQMIGRGLRGPLNGGKERCLIVNVKDNIAQYGEKLAFTEFEYLWKRE